MSHRRWVVWKDQKCKEYENLKNDLDLGEFSFQVVKYERKLEKVVADFLIRAIINLDYASLHVEIINAQSKEACYEHYIFLTNLICNQNNFSLQFFYRILLILFDFFQNIVLVVNPRQEKLLWIKQSEEKYLQ